jgi:hypothetical protein
MVSTVDEKKDPPLYTEKGDLVDAETSDVLNSSKYSV